MAKRLPGYPETVLIVRAGLPLTTGADALNRHVSSVVKAIKRASFPCVQKIVSVPEYQADRLTNLLLAEKGLTYPGLSAFQIRVRPDGTFGENQHWHEFECVENPGQIVIADADFGHACIETAGMVNGEGQLPDEAFSARFIAASKLAEEADVKVWGFQRRQGEGPRQGIQRMNASASVRFREDAGFSVGTHYIQQFMVFKPNAKGDWPHFDFKEDLGRCISEGKTGRYESTLIRFFGRGNNEYDNDPRAVDAEKKLIDQYGRKIVKSFNRHQTDPRSKK
jgi:hypothetical protein